MASNDDDDDYTGHPLFPIPMDRHVSARRRFDLIQIVRILPDKKTRETCPHLFKGSELRSWEQVIALYGGECYYQLQGVCSKTRQYTARSERAYFGSPPRRPFDSVPPILPPITKYGVARRQEPPPIPSSGPELLSQKSLEELMVILLQQLVKKAG